MKNKGSKEQIKVVKRFTFDKQKFKRLSITASSILVSVIAMILIVLSLTVLLSSMTHDLSTNIFYLKNWRDKSLVLAWIISGGYALGYLIYKRKNTKARYKAVSIFILVIFLSTFVPLFNIHYAINAKTLRLTVHNTFIFFIVATILLALGYVLTLITTREALRKSNWWAFFVGLPYIFIGWKLESEYKNLHSLINMKSFKYADMAKMIKEIKHTDLLMINSLWYKFFSLVIVVWILMMGLMSFEIVWEKTKKWRKIESKTKGQIED